MFSSFTGDTRRSSHIAPEGQYNGQTVSSTGSKGGSIFRLQNVANLSPIFLNYSSRSPKSLQRIFI